MNVLIACEYSGIIREAFSLKGHNAWSCDLRPTEIPGNHYECDVVDLLTLCKWDLLIAHPPCTYMSCAGVRHLYPAGRVNKLRMAKGFINKKLFMYLWESDIGKICIENPVPIKAFNLPKRTQSIQPYEYGHPYKKQTFLWLKNLPPLIPTNIIANPKPAMKSSWFNGGPKKQKRRAKTFTGIAQAMADQWG